MKKAGVSIIVLIMLIITLSGCGRNEEGAEGSKAGKKILKTSEAFVLETLNPHLDYQGWYTSIYGLTEALFVMKDQSSLEPLLAESAEVEGKTWTIKIKKEACFSNNKPVTAGIVIQNLLNAGAVNPRFAYLSDYAYEEIDEKTLRITTQEVYPTLMNDLASPELAIVDLENSAAMVSELVATGPFVVDTFEAGGTLKVKRNEKYWGGEVKLDGAEFYYMPEPDTSLLAMQNGEIDGYTSVNADAVEIFSRSPEKYQIATIPATRLQFYILNSNRLDATVRKAINLTIDSKSMEGYLKGSVTSTAGPFGLAAAYGRVTRAEVNTIAAKELLEGDGYFLNSEGYYEKDGTVLELNIAYYAARSLDTLAALMQEQLKKIGIRARLTCEEDPDGTYVATGDFDIALYCMIADKAGDPYYFISCTLAEGAPYNCGGFANTEVQAMIDRLKYETNQEKRAELANNIVQRAINEDAFGYIALFNKTTVMRTGVTNLYENCPFDFYYLNAATDIE